jgi:hypothetical protein
MWGTVQTEPLSTCQGHDIRVSCCCREPMFHLLSSVVNACCASPVFCSEQFAMRKWTAFLTNPVQRPSALSTYLIIPNVDLRNLTSAFISVDVLVRKYVFNLDLKSALKAIVFSYRKSCSQETDFCEWHECYA